MNTLMQLASDALHTVALFRTVRTHFLEKDGALGKQYLFKMQFNTTQKRMVD